jgi:hypothetical protein
LEVDMHTKIGDLRATTVQLRESEHAALARMAKRAGISKSAKVRTLIQREARDLGVWDPVARDRRLEALNA